jgi:hypothetical protein
MAKMSERDLLGLCDGFVSDAQQMDASDRSPRREDALKFQDGDRTIVEIEPNKSQVVSPDLADALEWIKPGLQRVFLASDRVGIYEPASEEDKDGAEQATDGINFYVMRRCEGYRVINDGIHDGLLHGNGIWKHYWDKSKQYKTETLTGLTQEEYDALLADDTMEKVLGEAGILRVGGRQGTRGRRCPLRFIFSGATSGNTS